AIVAVALAALRNADDSWAGGLLLGTPALLCGALVGAACGKEASRSRRLGFSAFGGAYFALAFLGLSVGHLAKLPATWLLTYIHQRVAPQQTFTFLVPLAAPGQTGPGTVVMSSITSGPSANTFTVTTTSQVARAAPANGVATGRWKSLLPGAANYEAFS